MVVFASFETPDVRIARLRTQLDSTVQSLGDTVTGLVDLEARRRAMEDNLRRFREVEQRQQPSFRPPEPARQPGIPSLVEDVFRQVGRFAAPGAEEAALPANLGGLAPAIPDVLVNVETRSGRARWPR